MIPHSAAEVPRHRSSLKGYAGAVLVSPNVMNVINVGLILCLVILNAPQGGYPCGACEGGKAASVYNYNAQEFASKNSLSYRVGEIKGWSRPEEASNIFGVLKSIPGIFPDTVTLVFDQRAVSFVARREVSFESIARKFRSHLPALRLLSVASSTGH